MRVPHPRPVLVRDAFPRSFVLVLLIGAGAAGCASAPVRPQAPAVPFEQKMAWMLQLEDQRILAEPEPPPAPQPEGRRGRPPAAAAAPRADLLVLARDPEARIRRRAAVAIGRVGLKEGVPILTPLLADADPDVRQAAAFALGLIGDASASTALVPLLADPEPIVRGRAAEALGMMGAKDAAGAVAEMAAAYARSPAVTGLAPDEERPAAAEAEALRLALNALVRLGSYEALAAAALDANGRPVATWWPVAYALQRIGDPRAAPALRALLSVQGRYTPAFAARGLGIAKDAAAADRLLPLVGSKVAPEVAASAIRALGAIGASQAAPALAALLAEPDADANLRLEALVALGALKAVEQLPYVQDQITDSWPAMRAAALRAAAAIDPESFVLILSGLERDRQWTVRAALADALALLPADIAVPRLTAMLSDEDRRVIPSVLRALAAVKAPEIVPTLLAHLTQEDFVIRETAATLIGELKPDGGVPALRAAYEAGQIDSAYGARAAAVAALAEYGTPDALEAVRAALEDKDWAVRVRAADLLADRDREAPRPAPAAGAPDAAASPPGDLLHAIRPAPGAPPVPYDDPRLIAPPYSPRAFIETSRGTIEIELAVLDAPQTARNFMTLARKGFFNGLPVHRVVPNFVVQDGDPRGDGEGGPGYTIRDELNDRPYLRGTVGMALAWRDTGGSQFFITHSPQPHLEGRYTVFGHVVSGMDVVDRLRVGDVIRRVEISDGTAAP